MCKLGVMGETPKTVLPHEPHPEKETDKGAVKSVREFLIKAGVEP